MSDWATQRDALVDRLARRERVDDDRVLDALRTVPRHAFLPKGKRQAAYDDTPVPIGEGQTISAPHMVAIMADLHDLEPGQTVLEIGTGCGYHAAVTAEIVGADGVYSVECRESLAARAGERLDELGYGDVSIRVGDGAEGWPDAAPFDRAYLTCATGKFPEEVIAQVRSGGLVLGPIGDRRQMLVRGRKRSDGTLQRETHGGVRFVRMQ